VKLSYKYRIYLNIEQQKIFQQNLNFCCDLYNSALQERRSFYKKYNKSISCFDQINQLPDIKKEFATQTLTIYSQSLQQVLKRLDAAYKNFFRRVEAKSGAVGFPRYKSPDRYKSILFPQCDLKIGGVKLVDKKHLKIFGLPGEVRIKMHRPYKGRCKQVSIVKQVDKFFVVLSCADVPAEHLQQTGKTVAIDLGLNSFITTDDGLKTHHPKPYRTAKEKLARLNRKLAAKQPGSNNRKRVKQQIARAYDKVSNIRNDFLHKTALRLVKENDTIITEKLNIKSMLAAKGSEVKNSNITDASWNRFSTLLSYKAERAGRKRIEVDPKDTSKTCSCCFQIKNDLKLQDRTFECAFCPFKCDRDQNAAINIRRLGMSPVIKTEASALRPG
jgi:putative transposase